ncbi:MAG: hypothetical protein IT243_08775 [Bacteroidia bacterium]|nr:hypothetical protein [Bacteroidia bacterium]
MTQIIPGSGSSAIVAKCSYLTDTLSDTLISPGGVPYNIQNGDSCYLN